MNKDEQIKLMSGNWKNAASDLGVNIETPYALKDADGVEVQCVAYLPDFGGSNGMVVGVIHPPDFRADGRLISVARSRNLGYSFINFEAYKHYNKEEFKIALIDWGFSGDQSHRPEWMEEPKDQ